MKTQQLFKDRIARFAWFWNSETEIRSATALRRTSTCYFNTRQLAFNFNHHLPHGSVVTRDFEPRQLQVPSTISSAAEPRTTDSGRSRITTGCREGGMFEFLWLTNNKAKWKLANHFNREKNKQTSKQKQNKKQTITTTTETKKQNQGSRVNNKDINKS